MVTPTDRRVVTADGTVHLAPDGATVTFCGREPVRDYTDGDPAVHLECADLAAQRDAAAAKARAST